jgi:hypothetical protein
MSPTERTLKQYSPEDITLQEELADVYFSQKKQEKTPAPTKEKTPAPKQEERPVATPEETPAPKQEERPVATHAETPVATHEETPVPKKRMRLAPLVAVVFLLVVLSASVWWIRFSQGRHSIVVRQSVRGADTVKIVDEGKWNDSLVKRTDRTWTSRGGKGGKAQEFIALGNSPQRESLVIDFKSPLDLSGKAISLVARGERGGENLVVSIRDSNKRSYHFEDLYLDSKWSLRTLTLARISGTIDLSRVEQLRVEYVVQEQSSRAGDREAYVKDVALVRAPQH